jgi:hypothetical protein
MKRLKYFALAALVAFAACDEGNESVVPEPDTGTISGTVTVDGQGLAGVTVTLTPTGATATTAANGDYVFSNVLAGAYTVAITGTPSDAAFSTTSKAAVITNAGQSVDVDFGGSYIRTSAITASVSVPGVGALAGATVSISGMQSASQVTGASGTANFSGLRAGAYTVSAVLGASSAALYDLTVNSFNVALAVDELEAVVFTATPKTISTITGRMYIDEVTKNNQFDAGNEENLTIADVDVVIEGVSVGVFDTIQTDANGEYELSGLPAANYRITLDTSPFNGAVALGTPNAIVITLGVADTEIVDFGFDIIEQRVVIGSFSGADEDNGPSGIPSRVRPMAGSDLDLFATAQDAQNLAPVIEDGTTGSNGLTTIVFDRADDTDPFGGPSDNVVFIRETGLAPAFAAMTQNGEAVIEVPFPAKDSIVTSADVFDYLNSMVTIGFMNEEIDGDVYDEINVIAKTDTTVTPALFNNNTNAAGMVYFNLTANGLYHFRTNRNNWGVFSDPAIPNPPDGILPNPTFTETFTPQNGATVRGSFLRYNFNGTDLPTDTVLIGKGSIAWDEAIIRGRVYREFNERQNYQSGLGGDLYGAVVANARIYLERDNAGTWVAAGNDDADPAFNGAFSFNMVPTGETYRLRGTTDAAAVPTNFAILNDKLVDVLDADGSDQVVEPCPLRTAGTTAFANCGTFAMKIQNNSLTMDVRYRDDTLVPNGTQVRVFSADSTIQGRFLQGVNERDDAIFTTTGGSITVTGVREGYYVAVPVDNAPASVFFASTNGAEKATNVRGQGVVAQVAQTTPNMAVAARSFHAFRSDAVVNGVVVNDRDEDGNTIDNNEALIGATVSLYRDDVGSASVANDSLVATATVGANGAYSFPGLLTQRYLVRATAPSGERVIANGSTTATYTVTTRASAPSGNPDRVINTTTPTTLPYWNYGSDAVVNPSEPGEQQSYFTFLFNNGTVSGTVTNDETSGPASPVTLQLVRCSSYDAVVNPTLPLIPQAGDCTDNGGTNAAGSFLQTLTAADGSYSFTGLREGVYNLVIVSASGSDGDGAFNGGLTTGNGINAESFVLFIDGTLDLEQVTFIVDN